LKLSVQINDQNYQFDTGRCVDLSIPLNFNGEQPNVYGADKAVSKPVEAGSLMGDTRLGGSCNFEQYTFIPHCNGTHTESIGHITNERISVLDSLKDVFIPAMVITVEPENATDTDEGYTPEKNNEDRLITRKAIENKLPANAGSSAMALIIRTLPNDESKKTRDYMKKVPPFFSLEAMHYIVKMGVGHLLVDMPSIDRMFDDGKLSNHRIFWNVTPGSYEINADSRIHSTVTEMIYVPDEVKDGQYLLNLQIAPFAADAAPSRPVIFQFV
jgi:kynurenine formamidase